jgi:hypothetical protein
MDTRKDNRVISAEFRVRKGWKTGSNEISSIGGGDSGIFAGFP